MLSLILPLILAAVEPAWHTDYDRAIELAKSEKKDLVIIFNGQGELSDVLHDIEVQRRLSKFVCLNLPVTYEYNGERLIDHPALAAMAGKPGLAIVSYSDERHPCNGQVISAHPIMTSRYRWAPNYGAKEVCIILDLPSNCTLTQRSMLFAVLVHPEQPRSVTGELHMAFLGHAEAHSRRQASMQRQHHANLGAASNALQSQVQGGFSGASEVVAESWGRVVGDECVLEACFSCFDAWRHSSGHWGAISRPHRYFAFDIARAPNGTWYATGIFGD